LFAQIKSKQIRTNVKNHLIAPTQETHVLFIDFNSKAEMAASDWTKDWSNFYLLLGLCFSIQLSTLFLAPYGKETFDTFYSSLTFSAV